MRRAEWLVIGLVALAVLGAVAVGVSGTVGAQEGNTSNESGGNSSVVAQVDEDVRVTDYELRSTEGGGPDVFAVSLDNVGDSRSQITITEVITESGGSSTFGVKQVSLRGGESTTVEVSMSSGGGGVMITTDESLANGQGTHLSESSGGTSLFSGDSTWTDVRSGIFFATAGGAIILLVSLWDYVSRNHKDVEEVRIE